MALKKLNNNTKYQSGVVNMDGIYLTLDLDEEHLPQNNYLSFFFKIVTFLKYPASQSPGSSFFSLLVS